MNANQKKLAKLSGMNASHLETLATAILSTLDGMPVAALREVVELAESKGAEWLSNFHEKMAGSVK